MKKIVLKATALAIGALVGGSAFAAAMNITTTLDLDANTGAQTYAKELSFASLTGGANKLNGTVKIGFGVSNGQTRYIRFDLTNAKFSGTSLNAAACAGRDLEIAGKVDRDNGADTTPCNGDDVLTGAVSLVQGGGNDQAYVVYQITAGGDIAATEALNFAIANLKVANTDAAVKIKYSLHETATSAQGTTASNTALLASAEGTAASFATGLAFTVDTNPTTTANVEKSFTEFKTGGGYIAIDTAKLGSVTVGVTSAKKADGGALAFSDLVAAGTKIVLTGDFSVRKGANDAAKKQSVFLSSDADCGGVGTASNTVPSATGAEIVIDTTAVATKGICYVVDGTSQIPAFGPYKASVTVVPAASTTSASFTDKDLGTIVRDGTELIAPFATIHGDYISRVFLTSTHTADAAVTAQAYYDNGTSCTGTPVALANLKAGKQMEYKIADVCPTLGTSTGSNTTRMSVKFTIAAPKSKIEGVYNQYKKGDPTFANGKTTDMNSYSLHRPVSN